VDTAEDDRRGVGRRRAASQAERIADIVGDVLDFGDLVVVGQDDRVPGTGELTHLGLQRRDLDGGHGTTSRETSSDRARWVNAPTEM
jgi:hypothetical protein